MNDRPVRMAARPYEVVAKVRESATITSFHLKPVDGEALTPFRPGQFLTFTFEGAPVAGLVRRNYSLSGDPANAETYRITVKREPAPSGRAELAPGIVSNHLHDGVEVGTRLMARGPDGRFVLDDASTRPVLLLSGGVGLTPLVAMAHALAPTGRATWFIHACESGAVHALGAEIAALAAAHPNLKTHVCYRAPEAGGPAGDSSGIVTRALLQSLLRLDDYDVYMCGPSAFMQAVFAILVSLGVREERIRYEFFGPATLLRASPAAAPVIAVPTEAPAPAVTDTPMVTFAKSGKSVAWDPAFETLLDFAEAQGLSPDFSCRAGICATCLCDLPAGEVIYVEEPLEAPEPGKVLICCSNPKGDVTIGI